MAAARKNETREAGSQRADRASAQEEERTTDRLRRRCDASFHRGKRPTEKQKGATTTSTETLKRQRLPLRATTSQRTTTRFLSDPVVPSKPRIRGARPIYEHHRRHDRASAQEEERTTDRLRRRCDASFPRGKRPTEKQKPPQPPQQKHQNGNGSRYVPPRANVQRPGSYRIQLFHRSQESAARDQSTNTTDATTGRAPRKKNARRTACAADVTLASPVVNDPPKNQKAPQPPQQKHQNGNGSRYVPPRANVQRPGSYRIQLFHRSQESAARDQSTNTTDATTGRAPRKKNARRTACAADVTLASPVVNDPPKNKKAPQPPQQKHQNGNGSRYVPPRANVQRPGSYRIQLFHRSQESAARDQSTNTTDATTGRAPRKKNARRTACAADVTLASPVVNDPPKNKKAPQPPQQKHQNGNGSRYVPPRGKLVLHAIGLL